jgi:ATP-dependent exoDNAse (exonuclease V) alpha subunit
MTINKDQGQMLKCVGIYLPLPVFTQGQLYVAFSIASSFDNVTATIIEQALTTYRKRQTGNIKHCILRSALKFQKYKQIFVD